MESLPMIQIQPYLFFNGRCEEAIAFYQQTLGAEVQMLMRFKEAPDMPPGAIPPGGEDKVMHATLKIGQSTVMMSDGHCSGTPAFEGFSLSFAVADAAAADRMFTALGAGGTVQMPLGKTFWSPCFGMLKDRYGVAWMVGVDI
jgi:PhnB protein